MNKIQHKYFEFMRYPNDDALFKDMENFCNEIGQSNLVSIVSVPIIKEQTVNTSYYVWYWKYEPNTDKMRVDESRDSLYDAYVNHAGYREKK